MPIIEVVSPTAVSIEVSTGPQGPAGNAALLAYAENSTGETTAFGTASLVSIPGTTIVIPKGTRAVEVSWQCYLTNTGTSTGGGPWGYLDTFLCDVTQGGFAQREGDFVFHPSTLTANVPYLGVSRGSFILVPGSTDKVYSLYAQAFNQGTGTLAGTVINATGTGRTWIKAVQL